MNHKKPKPKKSNVTPIRKPPDAGNFLDDAAALAGYAGRTSEWASVTVHAEAERLFAKQSEDDEKAAIEYDWEAIAIDREKRLRHLRYYLLMQFMPTLAAQARVAVSKDQLINDAELMVEDIESGRAAQRAREEQRAVQSMTETQAKAEIDKLTKGK